MVLLAYTVPRLSTYVVFSLGAGLAEFQLKELAYAIFLSCAGAKASHGLLASLRASLELSEMRAGELVSTHASYVLLGFLVWVDRRGEGRGPKGREQGPGLPGVERYVLQGWLAECRCLLRSGFCAGA